MKAAIEAFKKIVIENFSRKDFQYHEWMGVYHLEIVEKIALELCGIYPNADRDVVQALVWFHDFGKPIDGENERQVTISEGPRVMQSCGFPQVFIEKVVEC